MINRDIVHDDFHELVDHLDKCYAGCAAVRLSPDVARELKFARRGMFRGRYFIMDSSLPPMSFSHPGTPFTMFPLRRDPAYVASFVASYFSPANKYYYGMGRGDVLEITADDYQFLKSRGYNVWIGPPNQNSMTGTTSVDGRLIGTGHLQPSVSQEAYDGSKLNPVTADEIGLIQTEHTDWRGRKFVIGHLDPSVSQEARGAGGQRLFPKPGIPHFRICYKPVSRLPSRLPFIKPLNQEAIDALVKYYKLPFPIKKP